MPTARAALATWASAANLKRRKCEESAVVSRHAEDGGKPQTKEVLGHRPGPLEAPLGTIGEDAPPDLANREVVLCGTDSGASANTVQSLRRAGPMRRPGGAASVWLPRWQDRDHSAATPRGFVVLGFDLICPKWSWVGADLGRPSSVWYHAKLRAKAA